MEEQPTNLVPILIWHLLKFIFFKKATKIDKIFTGLFETNVTKVISKNVLVKRSEKTLFFTCILPDYVVHESSKEFWKIRHFENMTAGFFLSSQISLRWEISWFVIEILIHESKKMSFRYVMDPKNNKKNPLDTMQTTFSEKNNY